MQRLDLERTCAALPPAVVGDSGPTRVALCGRQTRAEVQRPRRRTVPRSNNLVLGCKLVETCSGIGGTEYLRTHRGRRKMLSDLTGVTKGSQRQTTIVTQYLSVSP